MAFREDECSRWIPAFLEFSLSVLSDCNQNDQSKPTTDNK